MAIWFLRLMQNMTAFTASLYLHAIDNGFGFNY